MCPVCKAKPVATAAGTPRAYCNDCTNKLSSQRRYKGRTKQIHFWTDRGPKKPPTDWREVLRKADEQKP